MATGAKAKTLGKIKDIRIIIQDVVIPTTLHVIEQYANKLAEVPISNSGTKNLKLNEDDETYSDRGDTFDEFKEKDEKDKEKQKKPCLPKALKTQAIQMPLLIVSIQVMPSRLNKNIIELPMKKTNL